MSGTDGMQTVSGTDQRQLLGQQEDSVHTDPPTALTRAVLWASFYVNLTQQRVLRQEQILCYRISLKTGL